MSSSIKKIVTIHDLPIIAKKVINSKKKIYDGHICFDFKNLYISGSYNYKVSNNNINHESNLHLLGMGNYVINEKCCIKNYENHSYIDYSLKYSVVSNNKPFECLKLILADEIEFGVYVDNNLKIPINFWYQLSNQTHNILKDIDKVIDICK